MRTNQPAAWRIATALLAGSVLAACADWHAFDWSGAANTDPPLTVENGRGSEHGNYAAVASGETVAIDGRPCAVWWWDRPLPASRVLRVRSASCPAPDSSGGMVAIELDRTVIPASASDLAGGDAADAASGTSQPAGAATRQ